MRYEIITKSSKPNVTSKRALGRGGSMKSVKAPSGKARIIGRTYCNEQRQCLMMLNGKRFARLLADIPSWKIGFTSGLTACAKPIYLSRHPWQLLKQSLLNLVWQFLKKILRLRGSG